MKILAPVSCRSGDKVFSYFLRSQSLFISRGVDDGEGHPSHFGAREGEVCMKDTDHHIRHPRGHLDGRASAQRTRGCVWRDDQFGHGQNTALGWREGPHFCTRFRGQSDAWVAPAHIEISSEGGCNSTRRHTRAFEAIRSDRNGCRIPDAP